MANEMRDKLFELLTDCEIEYAQYLSEECDKAIKGDVTKQLFKRLEFYADRLIENGVVFPQWISVKDRLPDVSGRYLTHCDVEGQSLVCILYFEQFVYGFEKEITHWMLLPKPPKAEQKLKEMRGENG